MNLENPIKTPIDSNLQYSLSNQLVYRIDEMLLLRRLRTELGSGLYNSIKNQLNNQIEDELDKAT